MHKAAKAAFDSLENKKLPTVKALQKEYSEMLSKKKNILTAKANVDRLLGENILEKEKKHKEQR
ncbi:hypothetical protein [Maledivibacter halophilus]|uniref:hypothetical protein n=1 Tax=Maledivibacter halophilus TaxID=36842 RepID=UPI001AD8AB1C|nr:hypothetical protein [Maledivibacter halophilus]